MLVQKWNTEFYDNDSLYPILFGFTLKLAIWRLPTVPRKKHLVKIRWNTGKRRCLDKGSSTWPYPGRSAHTGEPVFRSSCQHLPGRPTSSTRAREIYFIQHSTYRFTLSSLFITLFRGMLKWVCALCGVGRENGPTIFFFFAPQSELKLTRSENSCTSAKRTVNTPLPTAWLKKKEKFLL